MKKKLFVIDGSAILYRSYFAFIQRPLINSKGQNTSSIFGTINTIVRLIEQFDPEFIAISFDLKGPTFRHEMCETYKANRPPMPEELITQIEPVRKFFEIINIKEFSLTGFEADDVLATLAENFKKEIDVVIVSGDKDFAQLVDKSVTLYDPYKNNIIDEEIIVKKYGLKPEQFVDYLAIVGDSADNISGVKGIGPKGAEKLLTKFKTLEGIYENSWKISSKSIKSKLLVAKEDAFISQKLAKIIRDVPIKKVSIENLRFKKEYLLPAIQFCEDYELKNLIKKIKSVAGSNVVENLSNTNKNSNKISVMKFETKLIQENQDFNTLLEILKDKKIVAIDTETTSSNSLVADLVGISLCFDNKTSYYISLNHQMAENVPLQYAVDKLKEVLQGKLLVGHNLKYDWQVLKKYDWLPVLSQENYFDTMIASYLIDAGFMRHSLDNLAEHYFQYKMQPISDLIGKGKKEITFDLVAPDIASFYAAEDAFVTFQLYEILTKRLRNLNLVNLYEKIELPLIEVLRYIEETGVWIDVNILSEISRKIQKKLTILTEEIYEIAGCHFNINSTQQLGKILFETLELPTKKKTKTGYSTDINVMESLKEYRIAELIIEYRQLTKLESTYVQALPKLINEDTGRIHSSFNQTITSTGRLSSTHPNLQNIPIRTSLGKEIRKAFAGDSENKIIVAADYSQIELRLMAIFSKDQNLVSAFKNKLDIHTQTASVIFEIPPEKITPNERRKAKVINFGILYGMGARKLSSELGITIKEAKKFIENYFEKFPTIKTFMQNQIDFGRKEGYVQTLFGRKLFLPDLNSSYRRNVSDSERIAVNMPIQGSAADVIKLAMISIHNKIKDNPKIKMLIQVHDELVFEVEKSFLEEAKILIKNEMENALPEKYSKIVSLIVDIDTGQNWFEAH